MAVISFTIPNAQLTRVVTALAYRYGYQDQLPDGNGGLISNPEAKADFVRRITIEKWMNEVRFYEGEVDALTARTTAINKVNSEVAIT